MTFPPWKKSSLLLPWPAPAACIQMLCGVRVRCSASSSSFVLMRNSHRTRDLTPLSYWFDSPTLRLPVESTQMS